jgi:hypothetical protein
MTRPAVPTRYRASMPPPAAIAAATTWERIAALRLTRQHLDARAPKDAMLEVTRDLVAVQAQVMSSAELSLHTRLDGLTRDDVRRALREERTLVKTWAMRGTLHLVAARELPELASALANRMGFLNPVWLRYFGVTAAQMQALQDAIGEVLTATPMTRQALAEALAARLGDPAFAARITGSWGTFLKPAANRGLLCFGPDEGRNVTFVKPADWLRIEIPPADAAATAAVIERHLAAFPGSSKPELARWWGVAAGELTAPLALLSDRLALVDVEGMKGYVRTADLDALAAAEPAAGTLRMLGGFDPYTLSLQKEAEPLLPKARRPLVSREAGWISAVLLDGGRVAGTWTHEVGSRAVRLDLAPWRRLARRERAAVEDEAARVAAFVAPGMDLRLSILDPA